MAKSTKTKAAAASKAPPSTAPSSTEEILLKADALTVAFTADKEGKIRLNCSSWPDPKVALPGEIITAEWRNGQVVLLRRKKR